MIINPTELFVPDQRKPDLHNMMECVSYMEAQMTFLCICVDALMSATFKGYEKCYKRNDERQGDDNQVENSCDP